MGSSRPTDKISPIRTGSSSPDSIRRSSRTDNGNLSSPIPASRAPTVNSPDSTHHSSSRTVNPASKARTGSNQASGHRSRRLSNSPLWSCVLCRS